MRDGEAVIEEKHSITDRAATPRSATCLVQCKMKIEFEFPSPTYQTRTTIDQVKVVVFSGCEFGT
jgi:hypothetical protein